jgi:hypothetical protein
MSIARYADGECSGIVSVGGGLQCRSKGGTAQLCGRPEYTDPSTPPRMYRRQEWNGDLLSCRYEQPACSTPHPDFGPSKANYEGVQIFDAADCELVNDAWRDGYSGGPGQCASASTLGSHTSLSAIVPTNLSNGGLTVGRISTTRTQIKWGPSGAQACFEFFGSYLSISGSVTVALSEEDTEEDAIDRALAATEDWETGTCADHSSIREVRTSGFSFTYRKGQTRVVISAGLISGRSYEARVKIYQRVLGSGGGFTDSGGDLVAVFTADGVGYTSPWMDLPNEAGMEYRAEAVVVTGHIESLTEDNWSIVDQYDAACALTSLNDSVRTVDGEEEEGPFAGTPAGAYGGAVTVATSPDSRTNSGTDECEGDGFGKFVKHNGTVTESLEQEDTDQAAETRAAGAIEWGTVGDCNLRSAFRSQRTTGFIFGWRNTQVKVAWASAGGVNYLVKVRFARRALGSAGPYLFYATEEQTITADASSEETDWITVPNQTGWETIAANCSVEAV